MISSPSFLLPLGAPQNLRFCGDPSTCFRRPSHLYLYLPFLEWHAKARQETARLVVGAGCGYDRHFPPAELVDLVVVDLREDELLAQAERVVAAAIETLRVDAAEVADSRQRDVEQLVEEKPHAPAAKRGLDANRLAGAQLERRDRLAGLDQDRLLARDGDDVSHRGVERLVVVLCLADADVHDDLGDARHLHGVAVIELLGQLGHDLVPVDGEHARRRVGTSPRGLRRFGLLLSGLCLAHCASVLRTRSYGSPQWRHTSARAPDSRTVCLARVGREHAGQTSITFE